jgi:hypothetical protein
VDRFVQKSFGILLDRKEHSASVKSLFLHSLRFLIQGPETWQNGCFIFKGFCVIFGAFAKLRRATTSFVMCVGPSVSPSIRTVQLGCHWAEFN